MPDDAAGISAARHNFRRHEYHRLSVIPRGGDNAADEAGVAFQELHFATRRGPLCRWIYHERGYYSRLNIRYAAPQDMIGRDMDNVKWKYGSPLLYSRHTYSRQCAIPPPSVNTAILFHWRRWAAALHSFTRWWYTPRQLYLMPRYYTRSQHCRWSDDDYRFRCLLILSGFSLLYISAKSRLHAPPKAKSSHSHFVRLAAECGVPSSVFSIADGHSCLFLPRYDYIRELMRKRAFACASFLGAQITNGAFATASRERHFHYRYIWWGASMMNFTYWVLLNEDMPTRKKITIHAPYYIIICHTSLPGALFVRWVARYISGRAASPSFNYH